MSLTGPYRDTGSERPPCEAHCAGTFYHYHCGESYPIASLNRAMHCFIVLKTISFFSQFSSMQP